MISKQKNIFIIFAVLLVIMVLFPFLTGTFTCKTFSYIVTSLVYWSVFCIPVSFYFFGEPKDLKNDFTKPFTRVTIRKKPFWFVLTFTPCFGTLFAMFIPVILIAKLPNIRIDG